MSNSGSNQKKLSKRLFVIAVLIQAQTLRDFENIMGISGHISPTLEGARHTRGIEYMTNVTACSVLVVDDNYYNRDLCRLALEHAGFDITEAQTGAEALKILKERTFNLMVLDLAMPELNGVDVIRELRNQPQHEHMLIVVMTANPHMATDEVELEVDFVLYKPIDILNFSSMVQRIVQKTC